MQQAKAAGTLFAGPRPKASWDIQQETGREASVPDRSFLVQEKTPESIESKATHCSGLPLAQVRWVQVLCAIHATPQQRRGHLVVQGGGIPIICLIYALPLLVPPVSIFDIDNFNINNIFK